MINRATLDFSYDEVVTMCRLVDVAVPVGLLENPLEGLDDATIEIIIGSSQRALAARSMVTFESDGSPLLHPAVEDMLKVISEPGLLVETTRHDMVPTAVWTYAADPQLTVEHEARVGGVHRFTVFDTSDLVGAVFERSDVTGWGSESAERVVGHIELDVEKPVSGAADSDLAWAEADLSTFRADVRNGADVTVVVLHRSSDNVIEGGEMRFCPVPAGGAWLLPSGGDDRVIRGSVSRVDTARLAAELISYLPGNLAMNH